MTLVHVPRPPKRAMNPDRPVSALLKTQIEHLHDAERRLPLHYRSEIYINAIKTEGEAATYISAVTQAIRNAHADARQRAPKPRRVVEIAATAAKPARKRVNKAKVKSGKTKRRQKK